MPKLERMGIEVRKVFLSSTTSDLLQYREVAQEVMLVLNTHFSERFILQPVSMDLEGQDPDGGTPLEVSRAWVREQCDWVVLIVAWHYGYVPAGSTCSVTEAEYLEAVACGKKVFVFLPGDLMDKPEFRYRALNNGERENLADWRGHPSGRQHEEALNSFKKQLRESRTFGLFRNLEDFRAQLSGALTRYMIKELFEKAGPEIVALGLQTPLQACFRQVELLAQLKRLHDTLHRIRQFGIRTWREEFLVVWPDDGDPPFESLWKYGKGLPEISRLIERIDNVARELPPLVRKALPPLDNVIAYQFPSVPECGKLEFSEATDDFASRVQRLFTGTDAQMGQSAALLDLDFNSLSNSTLEALDQKQVLPDQEALLRIELERATLIHQRLQNVLRKHRQWQSVHDELERIDSRIEPAGMADDESALAQGARQFRRAVADLIDANGQLVRDLLVAATEIVTQDPPERLAQWPKLILAVGKHLDALIAAPEIGHYEAMRKHFDDLFFQIDLETLFAVEDAEDRVRAIESGLNGKDAKAR
jgi:hypothetical protein